MNKIEYKECKAKLDFYKYIFDNMKAFVWINRYDGPIWINKHAYDVFGHTVEDIKAFNPMVYQKEFFHPDDIGFFEESSEYLGNPENDSLITVYRQKSKEGKWIRLLVSTKVTKRLPNNMPEETINCAVDISEKFAELGKVESILRENAYLKNKIKLKDLTTREVEIITQIATGKTTREVGAKLNISFHTVEAHRKRILKKLVLKNVAELVRFAGQCGLV